MFLSDRDLGWAIDCGKLVFVPPPIKIDPTSIDLHLDAINHAKIWDVESYSRHEKAKGNSRPELRIGKYSLGDLGGTYLITPPEHDGTSEELVTRRGREIIIRKGGFLLWQTKEVVGTNADKNADLICFVDGKSTRARAGILVHLTAPTIHTTWSGKITLEIANLGPFDIVLEENDVIAQLTVAKVTSPPSRDMPSSSVTYGQNEVTGKNVDDIPKSKRTVAEVKSSNKRIRIGQKFGELTVVKELEKRESEHRVFECRCSCGGTHVVRGTELTQGRSTRCSACSKAAGVATRERRNK